MYISKFKIDSYKSFLSSGEINLTKGFNIIVGQNNIGKSSLTEALSTHFPNKPHRSLATSPEANSPSGPNSSTTITFTLSFDELTSIFRNTLSTFHLSMNPGNGASDEVKKALEVRFNDLISQGIQLECKIFPTSDAEVKIVGYEIKTDRAFQFKFNPQTNKTEIILPGSIYSTEPVNQLPNLLCGILRDRIYAFKAERLNIHESATGANRILKPDASNLPEVLNALSTRNPHKFAKLNELITTVFPQIKQITAPQTPGNTFLIHVWSIEADSEREDLAVSLQESGTGVGQILSILYVVLTADLPQVIIIDEPQSFLHPGAVRKLIDILKMYPQHQYIMTTHSPTVVTSSNPETLLMVTKEEAESRIQVINSEETRDLERYLSEIGARLSDVFGSDNILWVEGSTEETCFPLITKQLANIPLLGTTILGVKQTGDFEGDQSDLAFELYKRLSQGNGLLPKAIAFIFDREGRTETRRQDLEREGRGTVYFLRRRMYENYLLNPKAIAAITSQLGNFSSNQITEQEITAWVDEHKWDTQFFDTQIAEEEKKNEIWLEKVHGAKVLEKIFSELSETRYTYDKVEHGELLTKWIIKNSPSDLKDITELLQGILATTNAL